MSLLKRQVEPFSQTLNSCSSSDSISNVKANYVEFNYKHVIEHQILRKRHLMTCLSNAERILAAKE